jgi:glutaredoxin
MPIILYSMDKCPFCVKAEAMFANDLASGKMVKKPASEAGGLSNGFPHFVSPEGKSHTGLPSSPQELYDKLLGSSDMGNTLIIFYEMPGCGHCMNAKKTLASSIANGKVKIMPHTAAGEKAQGFPAFESVKTGKMSLGAPSSYEELSQKLGIMENYHRLSISNSGIGIL